MAFWLMKSEPESYSWGDLVRDKRTDWDGVRNAAARIHPSSRSARSAPSPWRQSRAIPRSPRWS